MVALSLLGLACVLLTLGWYTRQTPVELAPYLLCAMGLVLYVLAFFGVMGLIDWILMAAGAACLTWMVHRGGGAVVRQELKRQLADPYLWGCVLILVALCLCLRGDQLLEWDAYNFWGPDIKSLYYREGFAAKYSNVAQGFGDYSPMFQLMMWWFVHLFGSYQEQFLYFGYFILSGLMLCSVGAVFRTRYPRGKYITWLLIPLCALALPGVSSTALYRTICVDPVMAILFGMVLCKTVMRPQGQLWFWKAQLLVASGCLALVKSIGLLWSVLAGLFYLLWWWGERRWRRFGILLLAAPVALAQSWSVYCRVMDRTGYLSSGVLDRLGDRLGELAAGTFLDSPVTRGYIWSYLRAFFVTPVHREATWAIDLSPFAIVVLLVAAALLLWRFGAVPRGKGGRLVGYILATTGLIYLLVSIGQLTMFYDETQYFEPVNAVTLMSRYCEPANTGLLMLVMALASGSAPGAALRRLPQGRRWVMGALAGVVLLGCTSYQEAWRRLVHDELDAGRLEHRANFEATYQPFLEAISTIPYRESGARVLLVLAQEEMNPIVVNAASPVSFAYTYLNQGGEADYEGLTAALAQEHCGYLYLMECQDSLLALLPEGIQRGQLYRVEQTGLQLELAPWPG